MQRRLALQLFRRTQSDLQAARQFNRYLAYLAPAASWKQIEDDEGSSVVSLAAVSVFVAVAASFAGASWSSDCSTAACAADLPLPSANPKADQFLEEFQHWFSRIGGDTSAVEIKTSKENPQAGLGVYAKHSELEERLKKGWWQWLTSWTRPTKDFVLATVPLDHAITAKTIVADETLGPLYQQFLIDGTVDERQLIMLFLLVERIRGDDSMWYPWINLLPQVINTPVFYGKAELAELQGTNLYNATQFLKDSLRQQWSDLQPAAKQLLKAVGPAVQGFSPTFNDFVWAHSVFWSRSITFPDPQICPDEKSTIAEPREGIIPGIDFCNHSPDSHFRWSVWNTAVTKKGSLPDSVSLVSSHKGSIDSDREVTIDYGDKSNEELLHLYGFTVDSNPNDALMIITPLPENRQAVYQAKMKLLQSQGLSPQFFLTSAALNREGGIRQKGSLASVGLPIAVWETLDILNLDAEQALNAEQSFAQLSPEQKSRFRFRIEGLDAGLCAAVQSSTKALTLLTSLRLLLEEQLDQLERGDAATTLEQDIQILEAYDSGMAPSLRSCIVYRASQKRLARGFLARVKAAMVQESSLLHDLQDSALTPAHM